MNSRWRLEAILRESILNLWSPRSRSQVLLGAACLLGSLVGLAAVEDWVRLSDRITQLESSGWTTFELTASDATGTPAPLSSCARIGDISGVGFVGSISDGDLVRFVEFGNKSISVAEVGVVPDLSNRALPRGGFPGVYVGSELAALLREQQLLHYLESPGGVAVVRDLPVEFRAAGLGLAGSILVPVPIGNGVRPAMRCIVVVKPSVVESIETQIRAAVETSGIVVVARQIAPVPGRHPYDEFLNRTSRSAFIAGGLLLGAMTSVTMRSRASEIGVYLVSGMRRADVFLMLTVETSMVAGVFALTATTALYVATGGSAAASSASYMLVGALAAFLVGGTSGLIASRRRVDNLLKDR